MILVVILFLVYGPKRLSTIGRSVGKGKREFMHSIGAGDKSDRPAELPAPTGPESSESRSPDAD